MKKIPLLLLLLALISGCATDPVAPKSGNLVNLYFVADTPRGLKLFSEKREFVESEDLALDLISDLVSGVITPLDPDYVNLWGSSNVVRAIEISGSIATIDLGAVNLNVGSEGEQRAIDQIVWTYLGINPTIKSVRFTVGGQVTESFAGHVDTSKEFVRVPDYEVLNPLQISSINEGQTVSNPITISGEACTFEANVFWRLSKDGKILKEAPATAGSACPERSSWSVKLDELVSGRYKFETIEYSAEDGSLFAIDDKNFVIK